MNLHGTIGHPPYHFRAEQLAAGGVQADPFSPVLATGGFQYHGAAGESFCPGVSQHGLNQLVLDDGLAELFALGRKIHRVLDEPVGNAHADGGNMQPAPVQHFHGGFEPLPFLSADNVLCGDPAIFKNDVASVGAFLAHFHVRLAAVNAGGVAIDDKGGNAATAWDIRVGARHHGKEAGVGAVGDKAFGAVEDIVIAVFFGTGFHRAGVGAHVRFGQAEGADHLPGSELGNVFLFLFVGTINQDALGADTIVGAHEGAKRRRGATQFKGHHHFLFHGQPESAKLFRNRQSEQAHGLHVGDNVVGNGVTFGHLLFGGNESFAYKTGNGVS